MSKADNDDNDDDKRRLQLPVGSSEHCEHAASAADAPGGFDIMKIVRERAAAARLAIETAKNGNSIWYTTSRESGVARQQQQQRMIPGAYAVDGPFLAIANLGVSEPSNHSNSSTGTADGTGTVAGTSDQDLDHSQWVEGTEDEVIAHPIYGDQQTATGLLPNAVLLHVPTNQRSREYWREKLLCSLSVQTIGASLVVSFALILVLSCKQGNRNQLPVPNLPNQNLYGSIQIPANPANVEAPTAQTFLESLNLPNYTQKAMENSRSPQSNAYQWMVNSLNINTNQTITQPASGLPKWRLIQRFAMATFYYSTKGDSWVNHRDWLDKETNECSWEQIVLNRTFSPNLSCNEMGKIKALAFQKANNMEGTIPPEISLLGNSLQSFTLNRQVQLQGTIPTEVGLLTKLTELMLSITNIAGTIPTQLGLLQSLGSLQIAKCHLSGRIPSEIGNLGSLSTLVLLMSDLTGSVPRELFQLPGLEKLIIDQCHGLNNEYILQETSWNMPQMKFLALSSRTLGIPISIPSEIGTMTELVFLRLVDWNLHSTIPNQLGKLEKLEMLFLEGNAVSGTLPPTLSKLTGLVHLDLSSNQLEGTLPPDLFSKLTKLQVLRINGNHFSASIPTEIGKLSELRKLELHNTRVSGTLPTELLLLKKLTSLVVTNTSLLGSIPENLCDNMYQKKMKCYGPQQCKNLLVKTNTTACHGTSLCGCDCGPCPTN